MDPAVALVQAYLRVNGYFTVTEYPLFEARPDRPDVRSITDLDLLAFRLPRDRARSSETADERGPRGPGRVDPALISDGHRGDMILAEVKEGSPRFNEATLRPRVLGAGLARFGCCDPEDAEALARSLLKRGSAMTDHGHAIRIIAFGSQAAEGGGSHSYQTISLGHVVGFLEEFLKSDWDALRHVQILEPGLSMLQTLLKARDEAGS